MNTVNRLLPLLSIVLFAACERGAEDTHADRAAELARSMILVDTHIDVPYRLEETYEDVTEATQKGDFDYPRAVQGGLDVVFMSIYIPPKFETEGGARELADRLIDMVEDIARRAPEKFALAHSVADARKNHAAGRISLAFGMENGAPIEGDLTALKELHARGIRYITLAHSESNHISDSSYDEKRPWSGLSPFGEKVVAEMNRLGIMIDVSHVSDEAFYDVLALTRAPVIASHSSPRHFTPGWERNMSDEMIVALAENGGVIQINFGSGFVNAEARAWRERYTEIRDAWLEEHGFEKDGPEVEDFERSYRETTPYPFATVDDVLDNIDHVKALVGVEHIGIGSDYDGLGDTLPEGLKDVSTYPNLVAGLLARGYSESDIEAILGENLLRVWSAVEAAAERAPDPETVTAQR